MIHPLSRRGLLRFGAAGGTTLLAGARRSALATDHAFAAGAPSAEAPPGAPADVTLRIGPALVELVSRVRAPAGGSTDEPATPSNVAGNRKSPASPLQV